jgi:2-hydroxy-6-oxonona-2,4-dienedioate hydrolase
MERPIEQRDETPLREWKFVPALGIEMHSRIWDRALMLERPVPIVLVAGLGMSSRYWLRLGHQLGHQYRVLAPDLPGFGRSPNVPNARWPGGPSVSEQADQLLAWMDAHHIQRAVLVGHSTGCQTVVDLAIRFPDRVEQIVLVAPTFDVRHRTFLPYLPKLFIDAFFETPSLWFIAALEYLSSGPFHVMQQVLRMIDDPIERKLPLIQVPALVLAGRRDILVTLQWARQVTSLIPKGVLVVIERSGHGFQHTAPAQVANVVGDFLEKKLTPAAEENSRLAPGQGPYCPLAPV